MASAHQSHRSTYSLLAESSMHSLHKWVISPLVWGCTVTLLRCPSLVPPQTMKLMARGSSSLTSWLLIWPSTSTTSVCPRIGTSCHVVWRSPCDSYNLMATWTSSDKLKHLFGAYLARFIIPTMIPSMWSSRWSRRLIHLIFLRRH